MATLIAFPDVESPPPQQDDMKLTADDKRWLSGEIKTQVASGLKEFGDLLTPHGWRKLTFWLREWGLAGTAIVIPVTLLGFLITVSIFAGVGIKENSKFQGATEQRLTNIESQLRTLNASQNPGKVLREIASLEPAQFAQNLPALLKVSEQPIANVAPTPAILEKITYSLRDTNQGADDYWPAVLRFIQFASERFASKAPAPGSQPDFTLSNTSVVGINPFGPHVTLKLDGATIENITFIDSRIIFTDKPAIFRNVRFIDCAFEFPETDNPSPYLRNAGAQLLASGFQSAYISGI